MKSTHRNHGHEFHLSAPSAAKVQLVGDFTGWCESPIELVQAEDGVWRTRVVLTPGIHPYRFLVDGEWRDDPECPVRVPNPYGTEDALVTIE